MSEQPPASRQGLAVGTILGKYRLEQTLEQREPLLSFLVTEQGTQQRYRLWTLALPHLKPEDRVVYLGHFQQEAGRLLALQHTHLLPFSDYGIAQGTPYLVSPYIRAQSLDSLLGEKGPLDLLLASRYLDQLASALDFIHEQGVWHLNLTANCLLLTETGNLLLAETGFARIFASGAKLIAAYPQDQARDTFLVMRDVQGRPLYGLNDASAPAPELLRGTAAYAATDIYALGAVIYRLLTGHRAFRGTTPEETVRQHLSAPAPKLGLWRAGVSGEVDTALSIAMAKDPARRFRSAGSFADAYHHAVAPNDTQRRPLAVAIPVQAPVPETPAPIRLAATSGPTTVPARPFVSARPVVKQTSGQLTRRRLVTLAVAGTGAVAAVTVVTIFATHSGASSANAPTGNSGKTTGSGPGATAPGGGNTGTVLAHTSDVPLNSAKSFPLAGSNNPGLLIHLSNNHFVAFNSTCTHAGCAVAYNAQDKLLECPCHGATFDPARNAAVVQGPATSALAAVPITVQADGTITTGGN